MDMKNTWIKLYFEILQDPKMGMMPDHLFRRTIELFLLAGQEEKGGMLPNVRHIAWALHTTEKDIIETGEKLVKLGILEISSGGYRVTHFTERQVTQLSDAERAKNYRNNKKASRELSDERSENVTQKSDGRSEIVTVDKDKEKDKEKDIEKEEIKREIDKREVCDVSSQTPAPKKHRYGNFRHVLLSDDELKRLQFDFPDNLEYIQKLDDYLENNPSKHYANHNLTIRKWIRRDAERKQIAAVKQEPKRTYSFAEVGEMAERGEL